MLGVLKREHLLPPPPDPRKPAERMGECLYKASCPLKPRGTWGLVARLVCGHHSLCILTEEIEAEMENLGELIGFS